MKDTLASQNKQKEEVKNQALRLETQVDAVVYFLQQLDIEMVNDILDDGRTYQDFPKAMFIHKLSEAFEKFKSLGNSSLSINKGRCDSIKCSYECPGFRFIGNHSNAFFELIFIHEEGIIQDIYECVDFKAEKTNPDLGMRIFIDEVELPF
jgi:hypothetical protein